jgi:hypothetical protein
MITRKTYQNPEPRTFKNWCDSLGLTPYPAPENIEMVLSYDVFCFFPDIELRKEREGELYGFWREYGDLFGECRTVDDWLRDFEGEIVNPTADDLKDMDLFIGHDQFWEWSSGKVEFKESSLWQDFKKMMKK